MIMVSRYYVQTFGMNAQKQNCTKSADFGLLQIMIIHQQFHMSIQHDWWSFWIHNSSNLNLPSPLVTCMHKMLPQHKDQRQI